MKNPLIIVVGALLALAAVTTAMALKPAPNVPPNVVTTTNVCLVYSVDGIYSGGIPITPPQNVSYRQIDSSPYFLWLPNQDRKKVDTLSVTPLTPEGCVGITGL